MIPGIMTTTDTTFGDSGGRRNVTLRFPATEKEKQEILQAYGVKPKRIDQMHKLHGVREGSVCGDCRYLVGKHYDKTYFKCRFFGNSNGPGTDWRRKWEACGKFNERRS
ncbi:MAG: hypothetical protein ABSH28_17400 [Acidobacteriota bacterium]